MNFLSPWVLWALPLAAAPVVIHLMHRRRHRTVEWGAMMFLLEDERQTRGRQRLREFLLLAARTLALLGLIIGIGRPIAGGWVGRVGGEDVGTVVLIVDRSPSMEERPTGAGTSKLAIGVAGVTDALEALGPTAELVVVDAVRPERVLPLGGADDLVDLGLDRTTAASSDLPAAFETAARYLEASAAGRAEIWVVSDGQESDWRVGDGRWRAVTDALAALPAGVRARLSLFPTVDADNRSVRVERAVRVADDEGAHLVLDVLVRRDESRVGTSARAALAIEVAGARSTADVEFVGDEARLVGHRIPIDARQEEGFGAVELQADRRPSDDRSPFVFGDEPTLETVVVTARDDVARMTRIAAELPREGARVVTRRLTPDDARDVERLSLDGAAFLVWSAPLPSDGELRGALESFVAGGGVALFLPPGSTSGPLSSAAELFGARWGEVAAVAPGVAPRTVATWRTDDDLLRTGEDGTPLPVGELELLRTTEISAALEPNGESAAELVTLASLAEGDVLLARATGTGDGAAYFLGALPTPDAGNLARQGVVWVALVRRALDDAARSRGGGPARFASEDALAGPGWTRVGTAEGASLPVSGLTAGIFGNGDSLVALDRAPSEDVAPLLPPSAIEEVLDVLDPVTETSGESRGDDGLLEEIWRIFVVIALFGLIVEALLCANEGDARPVPAGEDAP